MEGAVNIKYGNIENCNIENGNIKFILTLKKNVLNHGTCPL